MPSRSAAMTCGGGVVASNSSPGARLHAVLAHVLREADEREDRLRSCACATNVPRPWLRIRRPSRTSSATLPHGDAADMNCSHRRRSEGICGVGTPLPGIQQLLE